MYIYNICINPIKIDVCGGNIKNKEEKKTEKHQKSKIETFILSFLNFQKGACKWSFGCSFYKGIAKIFCLWALCITLLWLSQGCSYTFCTGCQFESAPFLQKSITVLLDNQDSTEWVAVYVTALPNKSMWVSSRTMPHTCKLRFVVNTAFQQYLMELSLEVVLCYIYEEELPYKYTYVSLWWPSGTHLY